MSPRTAPVTWLELVARECTRHPYLQAVDLYKLVHQGCCGPGHAVRHGADAARRLSAEWDADSPVCSAPLWEPLDPHERYGRIHVRPYRRAGGTASRLLAAFVDSADVVSHERVAELALAWAAITQAWANAEARVAPACSVTTADLIHVGTLAERDGWPARHHSDSYRRAANPSYRVVRTALCAELTAELRR